MNKRVADYIFGELARQQVTHVFMLSGGGIMYLTDALGRSALGYVPCHHEQSAAIAAQAYAQQRNCLGVCLVTTGPGGTNALTGCAAAYVDSTWPPFSAGANWALRRRLCGLHPDAFSFRTGQTGRLRLPAGRAPVRCAGKRHHIHGRARHQVRGARGRAA